ncbi:hypothetical protein Agub_g10827 [Astrephomene gubernaculifera]|uniref:Uncharacterized protein n=1 Tax=Astrephomene gubernaculifera TaxID=47775 RepID=A0AAD3DVI9_9CHLO|nr:hypothetical protein Agub_g10827 [Astrephomene gubernaculifera]
MGCQPAGPWDSAALAGASAWPGGPLPRVLVHLLASQALLYAIAWALYLFGSLFSYISAFAAFLSAVLLPLLLLPKALPGTLTPASCLKDKCEPEPRREAESQLSGCSQQHASGTSMDSVVATTLAQQATTTAPTISATRTTATTRPTPTPNTAAAAQATALLKATPASATAAPATQHLGSSKRGNGGGVGGCGVTSGGSGGVVGGSLKAPVGLSRCTIVEDAPFPPPNTQVVMELHERTLRVGGRRLRYRGYRPADRTLPLQMQMQGPLLGTPADAGCEFVAGAVPHHHDAPHLHAQQQHHHQHQPSLRRSGHWAAQQQQVPQHQHHLHHQPHHQQQHHLPHHHHTGSPHHHLSLSIKVPWAQPGDLLLSAVASSGGSAGIVHNGGGGGLLESLNEALASGSGYMVVGAAVRPGCMLVQLELLATTARRGRTGTGAGTATMTTEVGDGGGAAGRHGMTLYGRMGAGLGALTTIGAEVEAGGGLYDGWLSYIGTTEMNAGEDEEGDGGAGIARMEATAPERGCHRGKRSAPAALAEHVAREVALLVPPPPPSTSHGGGSGNEILITLGGSLSYNLSYDESDKEWIASRLPELSQQLGWQPAPAAALAAADEFATDCKGDMGAGGMPHDDPRVTATWQRFGYCLRQGGLRMSAACPAVVVPAAAAATPAAAVTAALDVALERPPVAAECPLVLTLLLEVGDREAAEWLAAQLREGLAAELPPCSCMAASRGESGQQQQQAQQGGGEEEELLRKQQWQLGQHPEQGHLHGGAEGWQLVANCLGRSLPVAVQQVQVLGSQDYATDSSGPGSAATVRITLAVSGCREALEAASCRLAALSLELWYGMYEICQVPVIVVHETQPLSSPAPSASPATAAAAIAAELCGLAVMAGRAAADPNGTAVISAAVTTAADEDGDDVPDGDDVRQVFADLGMLELYTASQGTAVGVSSGVEGSDGTSCDGLGDPEAEAQAAATLGRSPPAAASAAWAAAQLLAGSIDLSTELQLLLAQPNPHQRQTVVLVGSNLLSYTLQQGMPYTASVVKDCLARLGCSLQEADELSAAAAAGETEDLWLLPAAGVHRPTDGRSGSDEEGGLLHHDGVPPTEGCDDGGADAVALLAIAAGAVSSSPTPKRALLSAATFTVTAPEEAHSAAAYEDSNNDCCESGLPLLHLAVISGSLPVVQLVLQWAAAEGLGPEWVLRRYRGRSALQVAAAAGGHVALTVAAVADVAGERTHDSSSGGGGNDVGVGGGAGCGSGQSAAVGDDDGNRSRSARPYTAYLARVEQLLLAWRRQQEQRRPGCDGRLLPAGGCAEQDVPPCKAEATATPTTTAAAAAVAAAVPNMVCDARGRSEATTGRLASPSLGERAVLAAAWVQRHGEEEEEEVEQQKPKPYAALHPATATVAGSPVTGKPSCQDVRRHYSATVSYIIRRTVWYNNCWVAATCFLLIASMMMLLRLLQ